MQAAILGADVLCHYGFLIDLRHGRLLDEITSLFMARTIGPLPDVHTISAVPTPLLPDGHLGDAYSDILTEFIKATVPSGELASITELPIRQQIVTTGPPAFLRPRRLVVKRLKAAKSEFDILLERGVI